MQQVLTDTANSQGCEECLKSGDTWVHLRLCRSCGHVGCCDDSRVVQSRTVVIATGAQYRKLGIENLARFEGLGIYYAATHLEAKFCGGEEVAIVGGGNSAGQAAVFLASSCRHVHVLVRSSGLSDTMSRYLIRRIEASPNITLHAHAEVTAFAGADRLERVTWRSRLNDQTETRDIGHVFLMTGAVPNTRWLQREAHRVGGRRGLGLHSVRASGAA